MWRCGSGNHTDVILMQLNNDTVLVASENLSPVSVSVPGVLSPNTWVHLAYTYDGTNLSLYVNGTLASTQAVTGALYNGGGIFAIGHSPRNPGLTQGLVDGLVDDMVILDHALSATEVAALASDTDQNGIADFWERESNCAYYRDAFEEQWADLRADLGLGAEPVDVDEDGLPELWALRLTALLLCTENPWNATAYAVYAPNLAELEAEAPGVQGYREVLAALLGMSQDLQDYFVSRLGLTGDYVVFQDPGKTPNEPLSGQGDLDRDGLSNAQEYAAVVASGGSIEDFAQMALFWQGAGAMPVAGLLGIIALGGACAAMAVRRIKRSQ